MEERISGVEDSIENMDTTIKENAKCKKILTQNIQEIQDKMRRPNIRIIAIDENEHFKIKGTVNIFNKIIEENFPNLNKVMPMNIQEAYRCPSTEEWIQKMWYIYTMDYYSAIKKNEFMKFLGKWIDLECIILSEVTQSQRNSQNMYSLVSVY
jgi:hypothetical protein